MVHLTELNSALLLPRKQGSVLDSRVLLAAVQQADHMAAAVEKSTPAENSLMDVETLTSATEFRLTVNEWLADIDAEETQAAGFNLAAYMDSPAVVKAPLSSIFGSALMPLLDDDTIDTY